MKILSAPQIKECDQTTIRTGISSIQLMEKAANACASWIVNNMKNIKKVQVFCGKGNNGGDGFAVARLLYEKAIDVEVYIDRDKQDFSEDAKINYKKIRKNSGIVFKYFSEFLPDNNENSLIIDALFGYGLNRNLSGRVKAVVDQLNSSRQPKLAIDIPSGLYADKMTDDNSTVFKADITLTFQFYKRSFMHPETGRFCGTIELLDIGLDQQFIDDAKTDFFVADRQMIRSIYQPRADFSNKGTFGKSILVGGSYGKMGSVLMSTLAALRTGSGLTFTMAPDCGYGILQSQVPEAMFVNSGDNYIDKLDIQEKSVYGIGPGLGKEKLTQQALFDFLKSYKNPVVLDADALNILAESKKQNLIPENSVITPHPLEFERLFGKTHDSFERLDLAKKKAKEHQIYIVLKDHHTAVVTPQGLVFYNITGNSGMAKGGSGDVLTGILTSLISQKYEPESACILGVWLHGMAGDLAAEQFSKEAMLPTDLIHKIADVFKLLSK